MSDDLKGFFYLVSAVCFILALRGLSSPESARKGNILGVTGMLIAAGVTLLDPSILSFELIISGALIGGAIGSGATRTTADEIKAYINARITTGG